MPPLNPARNSAELVERIDALLQRVRSSSRAATQLFSSLRTEGKLALFGGAVRDLALMRPNRFRSDLDLVVNTEDENGLARVLGSLEARRNRHGGFRVRIDKWRFDVWSLSSTWAFKHGYVKPERGFEDLPSTTFFTWDAVVYGVDTGILYFRPGVVDADEYLADLLSGVLEINLEPNPNPIGNVIRALRLVQEQPTRELGERLTQYAVRTLGGAVGDSRLLTEGRPSRRILAANTGVPLETVEMVGAFLMLASRNERSRFRFPRLQYPLGL